MKTTVVNNMAVKIAVESRLVSDSAGKTYSGTNEFEIPANCRKNIPSNVFTKETIEHRTPLQIHIKIGGIIRKVLRHEEFEDNGKIIFGETNGGLEVTFVPREVERGFRRFWSMVPFGRWGDSVADAQV